MKEAQKTRLATLVPAEKLENVVKQMRGQSDARIEHFIKVLQIAKLRMFRLDIAGEVMSASEGESKTGKPEVVLSINCTVNSLATRLSGGEVNLEGVLDDMSSGETIRRFSFGYCEALARGYNTTPENFILALNAYGGSYKATAKLQEEGEEWSGNGETGKYTNDWYRDEAPKVKLSQKGADWILEQRNKIAKPEADVDPFDGVKADVGGDTPMPF